MDGSSKLYVKLSVRSIFSTSKLPTAIDATGDRSVLRADAEQIYAGYSVYGPSTALVVTTGTGVLSEMRASIVMGGTPIAPVGAFRSGVGKVHLPILIVAKCRFGLHGSAP